MFRIDDATATPSLPTPEAAGTEGYFTEGNPVTGEKATDVRASWLNMVQEEIRSVVVAGGLTPSKTTYNQVLTAIEKLIETGAYNYAADTGSGNSYVIAMAPVLLAQVPGMPVWFAPGSDNTGASTITVNALAAADIKYRGAALLPGRLRANAPACIMWTGTYFELLTPCQPAGQILWHAGTTAPAGAIKLNGAAISRTTYASLWACAQAASSVVSEATWTAGSSGCFSVGDGATTFRVPDLRGEFLRGLDDGRGVDAARVLGVRQSQDVQPHTHPINYGEAGSITAGFGLYDTSSGIANIGASTGAETRPRNIAYLACITY